MAKKIFCFAGGIYFAVAFIDAAAGHGWYAFADIIACACMLWLAYGDD